MLDTINLKLLQSDVVDADFVEETTAYLSGIGELNFNGDIVITGSVGNLKVSLNRYQIKIKDGSLCKWFLGNNFEALSRRDIQMAIEKLSDILLLPIHKATVTRLDVAQNFICRCPVEVYFNHLGVLKHATRLQEPNGVYYKQANGRLSVYDKIKEQKSKGEPIPELYKGCNVLRYEQRYTKRLASQFGVPKVTAEMLYDEVFYIDLVNRWKNVYNSINKINDITLNFEQMENRRQLYKMGVLALIERLGGELCFIEQVVEAQKKGILTKKQAYDLKQVAKEACKVKGGFVIANDAIKELDKKVDEAVKYYR